jgi:Essential protein Yae1, N terminal
MGPLTCPRCGTPMWTVADRVLYVQCGHRPVSVTRPPFGDVLDAYERWSYGEGWTDGLAHGRRQGFDDGYRAGFDAGAEVGAVRVLLALEHVLQDGLPDLLPELPHSAEYGAHRKRTAPSDSPCDAACGHCSRCIRAAAVAANLKRFGHPHLPGAEATPSTRRGHEGIRRALPSARPLAREALR